MLLCNSTKGQGPIQHTSSHVHTDKVSFSFFIIIIFYKLPEAEGKNKRSDYQCNFFVLTCKPSLLVAIVISVYVCICVFKVS